MFTPWEPKLLMDVFILIEHQQNYDIIKHVNKDCVHTIYFDPQKYPVCNKFKGEGYSLLCKDLATSAINPDYQIVKNGFYNVGALTTNRFSCSRCFALQIHMELAMVDATMRHLILRNAVMTVVTVWNLIKIS